MAHWHTVSLNKNKLMNINYIGCARARVSARYHINGAIGIPKMPKKKFMTLEEHVEMGQAIKDVINATRHVLEVGTRLDVLTAKEQDRLIAAINNNRALAVRCPLEDKMFADLPWLTNDAFNVYYHTDERADAAKLRKLSENAGRRVK